MSGFGSLYITFLTPSQYTRRASLKGVKKRLGPLLVNTLCFGAPILSIAILLPLQVHQSSKMRVTMHEMTELNSTLSQLSNIWVLQGNISTETQVTHLLKQSLQAKGVKRCWNYLWCAELAVWSFWTLIGMAVAVLFGLQLVLSTNRRIRRMAASQYSQANLVSNLGDLSPQIIDTDADKTPDTLYARSIISPSPSNQNLAGSFLSFDTPLSPPSEQSTMSFGDLIDSSAAQTPATPDLNQPFSSIFSSSSFSSLQPPKSSATNLLQGGRSHFAGRPSLHAARRISSYAIFPGRLGGVSQDERGDFGELHQRYWHVAAQYVTVLVVMACTCAFALFEMSSETNILTE